VRSECVDLRERRKLNAERGITVTFRATPPAEPFALQRAELARKSKAKMTV